MSDIGLLQKIGLSKYQALIYACLLRKGPLDARILSLESQVPMGKIYDTLSLLLENEIITEHAGRPKKYEAVIPEIAFQRMYMKQYIEHERQRDDLKNTITQLEHVLQRRSHTPTSPQNLQIMHSNEDILNYFVQIHTEAKKEVIYVTHIRYGSFYSELDERTLYSLINNMVSLLNRGISVKVIYPDSPYLKFFSRIAMCIKDDIMLEKYHDLIEIRVCNTEHNFILVDNTTCILEAEDQIELARPYAMIRLRDPVLNSRLREVFQKLWETAIPMRVEPGQALSEK